MSLDEALEQDILQVLPFGGGFRSVDDVASRVAPLREGDVRRVMIALHKQGKLDHSHGGGGMPAVYGRKPIERRF